MAYFCLSLRFSISSRNPLGEILLLNSLTFLLFYFWLLWSLHSAFPDATAPSYSLFISSISSISICISAPCTLLWLCEGAVFLPCYESVWVSENARCISLSCSSCRCTCRSSSRCLQRNVLLVTSITKADVIITNLRHIHKNGQFTLFVTRNLCNWVRLVFPFLSFFVPWENCGLHCWL